MPTYLTLEQWLTPNPAANFDFWLRDPSGGAGGGPGDWYKFLLPPPHIAGLPTPILRRHTMYARPDSNLGTTTTYALPSERQGYTYTLTPVAGAVKLIAAVHVNTYIAGPMFDRFGAMLAVEDSHIALLAHLRGLRDNCIQHSGAVQFSTDGGFTHELYYIHTYNEDIIYPSLQYKKAFVADMWLMGIDGVIGE